MIVNKLHRLQDGSLQLPYLHDLLRTSPCFLKFVVLASLLLLLLLLLQVTQASQPHCRLQRPAAGAACPQARLSIEEQQQGQGEPHWASD
jgi:hypothetical protein